MTKQSFDKILYDMFLHDNEHEYIIYCEYGLCHIKDQPENCPYNSFLKCHEHIEYVEIKRKR
jgi:hypothetical protein